MGPRIAILLSGSLSDVSVSHCAVQLAARSESKLYALQDPYKIGLRHCNIQGTQTDSCTKELPLTDGLSYLTEIAGTSGVPFCCYSMEKDAIAPLGDILIEQAISCLEVGNGSILSIFLKVNSAKFKP